MRTGRPLSTKNLALKTLRNPRAGNATKLAALALAKRHLTPDEYERCLRQIAKDARGAILRLCLVALAEYEAEARVLAEAKGLLSRK
jgi:hypothetical protein